MLLLNEAEARLSHARLEHARFAYLFSMKSNRETINRKVLACARLKTAKINGVSLSLFSSPSSSIKTRVTILY